MRRMIITILLTSLLAVITGCASDNQSNHASNSPAASAENPIASADRGTITSQVKALWEKTRPIIETDMSLKLKDEEYQQMRDDIFAVWINMQVENSTSEQKSEAVSQVIPRVLELIDHVYGFPGSTKEEREESRKNTERTKSLFQELDEKIAALP